MRRRAGNPVGRRNVLRTRAGDRALGLCVRHERISFIFSVCLLTYLSICRFTYLFYLLIYFSLVYCSFIFVVILRSRGEDRALSLRGYERIFCICFFVFVSFCICFYYIIYSFERL